MPSFRDIQRLDDRERASVELQRALHRPDPTLGWRGDPDLILAFNRLERRWEVWREEAWQDYTTGRWETIHRIIARAPTGDRLDVSELIRGLVERDTLIDGQDAVAQVEKLFKDMEADERRKDAEMVEAITPVHEKLAWTIAKDTGNSKPFLSVGRSIG